LRLALTALRRRDATRVGTPPILGNLGDNFLDASDGRGRQAELLRCTLDRWARYPGMKRRRLTHKLSKPERVLSVKDSLSASSAVPSAAR